MALDKDKRIASSLPQPMVEEILRIVEQEGDFGSGSVTAASMATALTSGTSAERTAFRSSGFIQGIAGTVANEAAMLAIVAPLNALDTVNRADTGTIWRYLGGDKAVLSNWRNEGVSGGAAGVQTGALAPSATLAPNADAVLLALSNKSDYHSAGSVTASVALNATDHADRRVDISSVGPVAATWNTGHGMVVGQCGRLIQTGTGVVTLSQGTGTVSRSPNVAVGALSTSGVGSWIDWEYMGGDLLTVTDMGVVAVGAGAHAMPVPVADVGAGVAATEVIVFETMLPALSPNAEVDIWIQWDGVGVGNKAWRCKLGGSVGVAAGGSLVQLVNSTSLAGRIRFGFRNQNNAASQAGGNGNIPTGVGTTTSSGTTSAVDTAVPVRLSLTVLKATGTDVVTFQGARVMVFQ